MGPTTLLWLLTALTTFAHEATADFSCVCNTDTEVLVYQIAGDRSRPISDLFQGDCLPYINDPLPGWSGVAVDGKLGYIELDFRIQKTLCSGDPGPLPTPPAATTTATGTPLLTTPAPTTPPPATATGTPLLTTPSSSAAASTAGTSSSPTIPPTAAPVSTQPVPASTTLRTTTPTHIQTNAPHSTTTMHSTLKDACPMSSLFPTTPWAFNDDWCYQFMSHHLSFGLAEQSCRIWGGHLVAISDRKEQEFLQNFLHNMRAPDVWIGLTDRMLEGHYLWVSGSHSHFNNFTPFHPHALRDCVAMSHVTGFWYEAGCDTHKSFICAYQKNAVASVLIG